MKSREEREKHYFDNSMGSVGGSSLMEEDVDDSELYDRVRHSIILHKRWF
jgi:hypothetical protein